MGPFGSMGCKDSLFIEDILLFPSERLSLKVLMPSIWWNVGSLKQKVFSLSNLAVNFITFFSSSGSYSTMAGSS
jgi:hypothetical protein